MPEASTARIMTLSYAMLHTVNACATTNAPRPLFITAATIEVVLRTTHESPDAE